MTCKGLYVFVEGPDDERFFKRIAELSLQHKYAFVHIIKHAKLKKDKIDNHLRAIKSMEAHYIYVVDINDSPCVTAKKCKLQMMLKNIDPENILVVIKEIESWYLAGLDDHACITLDLKPCTLTDGITKEQFNSLIPKKFDSRVNFMIEILKIFSIETAKTKNRSFRYFIEKYDCE